MTQPPEIVWEFAARVPHVPGEVHRQGLCGEVPLISPRSNQTHGSVFARIHGTGFACLWVPAWRFEAVRWFRVSPYRYKGNLRDHCGFLLFRVLLPRAPAPPPSVHMTTGQLVLLLDGVSISVPAGAASISVLKLRVKGRRV